MRIVVIGAGVIGSSLAFRLAQAGQQVTLIERADAAQGTTGSTFAWINSNTKVPEDYFALNVAGVHAHRELRRELGEAPWLHEGGNVVWAGDDEQASELESRVARLQQWNYPVRWIAPSAMAELEPKLSPGADVEQLAYFEEEAWIDGPQLAGSFVALAQSLGADVRFRAEVTAVDRDGVTLANGERVAADLVVNCAGPAAGAIAALAGRNLPLANTPGLVLRVSNAGGLISRVLHAPDIHMRPDSDGLVMLHHGDADHAMEAGEHPSAWIAEFFARAAKYVPEFADARLSRWSIGIRPIPADDRTSAGLVASAPGYAEIVTHSGITLGPLLGKLVAQQIVAGTADPLLEPFSPNRFG